MDADEEEVEPVAGKRVRKETALASGKLDNGEPGAKLKKRARVLVEEIDLFPVASNFEVGFDGKVERSTWDCLDLESGFSSPLLVRVATVDRVTAMVRRKKRKRLGSVLGFWAGFRVGFYFCLDLSLVSSTLFVLGPGSSTTLEDLLLVVEESWTVFEISDECSSMSKFLTISDISDECSSPGFAENKLIGAVTVAKPLVVSARKDSQA
ncbi:hypothetical protein FH972_010590 [Carpinus fangiana]|uniref:Uncharacterized protein n=1 Tax=Carpinus fangiana TaxID=176857 RepID=A0A660KQH7_9ROSI|nr:hypothetical protein FH972_010590 [Carpinus fangiana]